MFPELVFVPRLSSKILSNCVHAEIHLERKTYFYKISWEEGIIVIFDVTSAAAAASSYYLFYLFFSYYNISIRKEDIERLPTMNSYQND